LVKKYLTVLIKLVVSVGLIFWLFQKNEMNFSDIFFQISHASLKWLVIGISVFTLSTILGALQWRRILATVGIRLSCRRAISFYYVGLFFNNFLPGYVAGDGFRIYDVAKTSGDTSNSVAAVMLDRIIGFMMLSLLAVLSAVVWAGTIGAHTNVIVWVGLVFLGWLLALFIMFNVRLAGYVFRLVRKIFPEKITAKLRDVYLSFHGFRRERKMLLEVMGISLVIQTLRIMTHYAAARAVGIDTISIMYFFLFIPLVALAVTLPISIGGFGIREQAAVHLFGLPGIGGLPSAVTSMEFMAYLIGIASSLPGGLIFIFRRKSALK